MSACVKTTAGNGTRQIEQEGTERTENLEQRIPNSDILATSLFSPFPPVQSVVPDFIRCGIKREGLVAKERGRNYFPMLLRVRSENQPVHASVRFGISNDSRTGR